MREEVFAREDAAQGPGKVMMGVRLEVIGVDAPRLEATRRARPVRKIIKVPTPC
jgi:hypothetical protein